jgi:hypothetical protein
VSGEPTVDVCGDPPLLNSERLKSDAGVGSVGVGSAGISSAGGWSVDVVRRHDEKRASGGS